jgi:hypothetical protein
LRPISSDTPEDDLPTLIPSGFGEVNQAIAPSPDSDVRSGSQAEKLKASKCFLLVPQQRTRGYVSLVPTGPLVAFDHQSGFSVLKIMEFLRAKETHHRPEMRQEGKGTR